MPPDAGLLLRHAEIGQRDSDAFDDRPAGNFGSIAVETVTPPLVVAPRLVIDDVVDEDPPGADLRPEAAERRPARDHDAVHVHRLRACQPDDLVAVHRRITRVAQTHQQWQAPLVEFDRKLLDPHQRFAERREDGVAGVVANRARAESVGGCICGTGYQVEASGMRWHSSSRSGLHGH